MRPALTEAVLSRPGGQSVPVDLGSILNNSNSAANLSLQPGDRLLITERTLRVNVTGDVKKAGEFRVPVGSSAADALAFAQGALPDAALSEASVRRADGTVQPVNLFKVVKLGDASADLKLREGDVLTIPHSDARVLVQGSVVRPGDVRIEDGRTLSAGRAVALAGGYTDNAALSKATVRHADGTSTVVNLYDVLVQQRADADVRLHAGDVLDIPEASDRVTVLGAVNKPGIYIIPDGQVLSVAKAVALAGSYNEKAALTRVTVRHDDDSVEPVDLYQVLVRGQQQNDVRLRSGDIVIVPELQGITVLGSVTRPGSYYLEEGAQPRLSIALATAGDLEPNLQPEDARISITRAAEDGAQETIEVDAAALLRRNDQTKNVLLQDGDLITVSSAEKRTVVVSGEVEKPGAYELQDGESLPQLIARAGGAKEDAALRQVRVVQNGQAQTVDVRDAVRDGAKLDFPLQAGANVVVPENKAKVLVLQAVNKPGAYAIPEGEVFTLGDALDAAGGTQPRAKQAVIARQLPGGEVERKQVWFDPKKNEDRLATNIPLQSGDVIYVPDGKVDKTFMEKILPFLGPLGWFFR